MFVVTLAIDENVQAPGQHVPETTLYKARVSESLAPGISIRPERDLLADLGHIRDRTHHLIIVRLPELLSRIQPRLHPSVDFVDECPDGTQRKTALAKLPLEDLLIDEADLQKIWILRKLLHPMDELAAMEFILDKLKNTKTNSQFFDSMRR